ncbi:MAG: hypothetical protein ABEJ31_04205 [Haloarculaceae archaeon]
MKTCPECGERIYRVEPDNAEFGSPVVDGRRYPEECPECGAPLSSA